MVTATVLEMATATVLEVATAMVRAMVMATALETATVMVQETVMQTSTPNSVQLAETRTSVIQNYLTGCVTKTAQSKTEKAKTAQVMVTGAS